MQCSFVSQVEVLRREAARLTAENNRLHGDLLRQAEAQRGAERAAAQRLSKQEETITSLQVLHGGLLNALQGDALVLYY